MRFGAQFFTGIVVTELLTGTNDVPHVLRTTDGDIRTLAVVIATGATYRRLRVPSLNALTGRGALMAAP